MKREKSDELRKRHARWHKAYQKGEKVAASRRKFLPKDLKVRRPEGESDFVKRHQKYRNLFAVILFFIALSAAVLFLDFLNEETEKPTQPVMTQSRPKVETFEDVTIWIKPPSSQQGSSAGERSLNKLNPETADNR